MNLNTFKNKISQFKEEGLIDDYEVILSTGHAFKDPFKINLIVRKGIKSLLLKDIVNTGEVYRKIRKL